MPQPTVNILLVDDHPANLLVLEAILDELGHNLVKASSGAEALELLAATDFAAILLDVQMQGMDGFETAKHIRRHSRAHQTPIIFLTAHESTPGLVEEAYSLGAVDYLIKPLIPIVLRAKVSGFVELYLKTEHVKRQAELIREMEHREFQQKLDRENARLRESEQRFSRFMQHLPGLAWIKDLQGRYIYANEAAQRAFQTTDKELYGKTDQEVFPSETAVQFRENDRRVLEEGTGLQMVETLRHGDGVRHSIVSKFPILGSDGSPMFIGGMAIDITDRLHAEHALQEADRRKDEFLAMLAHELRNPLAPIRNALEILKLPQADEPTIRKIREIMERQVDSLVRLVDDLLDVSRVMRAKIELRKEPVELASVVSRAVETVQPLMIDQGHKLDLSFPSESLLVNADPIRLAQVVSNLLTNAAKYTESNGQIWLSVERDKECALLKIRDNGIGIAPDLLPQVFELFVQAEHTTSRAHGGLGIGLTLVKNLVEMHGGTVQARSEGLGMGCEFEVRLPLFIRKEAGATLSAHPTSPSTGCQAGHRLLVVDDNQDAAVSLAMLLRLQGHDVQIAHNGPAGIAMASSQRPDMIFLDIGMPGMDGYDVAREIRRRPVLQNVVLVALTGWGQKDDRRRSAEAGFDHHLLKPAEPKALAALLADLRPSTTGDALVH